ncbi:MAG: hypothetical protein V1790_17235 [Planctomycetota bacterium]
MNPAIRENTRRGRGTIRGACVLALAGVSATLTPAGIAVADPPQGAIVAWGQNLFGQTNVPAPNADFIAIAAGQWHSLGLRTDGSIVALGCGNGSDLGQCNVPAPNSSFVAMDAGYYHSLALKADGSIVAWGYNGALQTNIPAPNADFVAIAAGWHHSLGLKADGSLVAWGCGFPDFNHGQCNVPAPNTGFIAVAAGRGHCLGVKADGSIVAWGDNSYGQTNIPSPNTGFTAVAAGGYHSLGLKAGGSIVGWGNNSYGETDVPAPNTDFIGIAAGYYHSLGLKGDGSIVAWGNNSYGQTNVSAPNIGFVAVAAGGHHSLGIRESIGACCDLLAGTCAEDVPIGACSGTQQAWTEGAACADAACDADGDGVLDGDDICPGSDIGETIVIDKCDTGIPNEVSDDGCTRADTVAVCTEGARNHGQFVQCVALLANYWKRSGAITDADRGRIIRCAARADIPPSGDEQAIGSNRAVRRPDRALQRSDTQQPLPLSDGKDGIPKVPGRLGGGS